MDLNINISAKKITLFLGAFALYLNVQSLLAKLYEDAEGDEISYLGQELVELVNVNREANLPTWYASLLLLGCAILLAMIAYAFKLENGRNSYHWIGLSIIFVYLSLDEAAVIHEMFTQPLGEAFDTGGYLYFAWLLVGIPFAAVVGLVYLRFLLRLPLHTRNLFILAAVFYLGGAIVIEAISANQWALRNGTSLTYSTIGTVEEFFEMLGAIVFIYALLNYLKSSMAEIHISFQERS